MANIALVRDSRTKGRGEKLEGGSQSCSHRGGQWGEKCAPSGAGLRRGRVVCAIIWEEDVGGKHLAGEGLLDKGTAGRLDGGSQSCALRGGDFASDVMACKVCGGRTVT